MENIKEKLLKIKRLAESGEIHESENAKFHLEKLLQKYSITLSDLEDNKLKSYEIKYHDNTELSILIIIMSNLIGYKRAQESTYNYKLKKLFLDATSYEFAEISAKFSWHIKNYKREKKEFLNKFELAYLIKHNLSYSKGDNEEKKELSEEEKNEILECINLSQHLSDTMYHKQLEDLTTSDL